MPDTVYNAQILDDHWFYKTVFHYLSPAFPDVQEDIISRLSEAGYTYFLAILAIDEIVDEDTSSKGDLFEKVTRSLELHERSVRELGSLFPPTSAFWTEFAKIKESYRDAVLLEKTLTSHSTDEVSLELLRVIGQGKSAISLTAVLALCAISGSFEHRVALEHMLAKYHEGLQVLDDIDDFAADLRNGQVTQATWQVMQRIAETDNGSSEYDPKRAHKYLFISGIASCLLSESIRYFEIAKSTAREYGLSDMCALIEAVQKRAERHRSEVEMLLAKTQVIAESRRNVNARILPSRSRSDSIERACRFLYQQERDGCWSDFLTSAGVGTSWISGYVGYHLLDVSPGMKEFNGFAESLRASKINGAFNASMHPDADSMTFLVGAYLLMEEDLPSSLSREWTSHCNREGGWCTYRDADSLRSRLQLHPSESVEGWLSPVSCVTASAASVLANAKRRGALSRQLSDVLSLTRRHLLATQSSDGSWTSYWWTHPLYATSFAVLALADDPTAVEAVHRARTWIVDSMLEAGTWGVSEQEPSALYTALALRALATSHAEYAEVTEQSENWLRQNQRADGSWATQRVLRIPSPSVTDPASVQRWRCSSFGTNVLVDDHHRVFTTSTVLGALASLDNAHRTSVSAAA